MGANVLNSKHTIHGKSWQVSCPIFHRFSTDSFKFHTFTNLAWYIERQGLFLFKKKETNMTLSKKKKKNFTLFPSGHCHRYQLGYFFLPHCARACQHVISLLGFPFYKFVCDTLIRLGEFALNVITCPKMWVTKTRYLAWSILWGRVFWNSLTIKYNFSEETCLCKKCYSIIIIFLFDTKRHAQFYPIRIIGNSFLLHVVHIGTLNLHAGVKLTLHQAVFF